MDVGVGVDVDVDVGVSKGTSVGSVFPQPLRVSNTKKIQMVILIWLNIFLPCFELKELYL